ncbi:nuclear transport factor 2 family protein [Streptomyces sp. Da 82-17]|uniref:nuclear transport factor 2 family protein n=1 Tax=Streptomyces sp. Da 82-17 TaxID=3377116 RepID=UPI0038D46036
MHSLSDHLRTQPPGAFVVGFYTSFTAAVREGAEDPGELMSRYFTRDFVQVADGVEIGWERLRAHLEPIRRNLREFRFELHEAYADGDRIAARFTIHARMRKGAPVSTRVLMFAEFTPDGRLRRAEQLTRDVPPPPWPQDPQEAAPDSNTPTTSGS